MSSASSAVTYTSVYTDSEPGRVFWGADEELSDGGSPRVIDEDEREPVFIQPHDPDYVPEPMYPEYIPLEDEHSDPEEDPKEYEEDETEDGLDRSDTEEVEEHLAPADSAVVVPTVELVSPPEGTGLLHHHLHGNHSNHWSLGSLILHSGFPYPFHAELPTCKGHDCPTLGPRYEVGEISTARPTRRSRDKLWVFVITVDAEPRRREIESWDLYAILEDDQDSRTRISQPVIMDSQRVDLLMEDRIAHQETVLICKESHLPIGLGSIFDPGTSDTAIAAGYSYSDTTPVMRDMRQEIGDMQTELLALREQQRRARQLGPDVRVPDHQDASRDADSHI
ncbi:hypothetical protein Tco_0500461 [Tanacetum coccineum]